MLCFISGKEEIVKFNSFIKKRTEENVEFTLKEIESRMLKTFKRKFSQTYNEYDYENVKNGYNLR